MRAIISASLVIVASASAVQAQHVYVRTAPVTYYTIPAIPPIPATAAVPTIPLYFDDDAEQQQETAEALNQRARQEMNRENFERAAEIYERLIEKFPRSSLTGDAHFWRAFSLYKTGDTDNLEEAQELLEVQKRRYANASTRKDGEELLVRIRGQLARTGDSDAAEAVSRAADQASQQCPSDDDVDTRAAALNAVMQMNAEQAMPLLKRVMAQRSSCYAELRKKAVFLISQKSTPEREDILLDAARNDPEVEVRGEAVFWLSQTQSEKALDAIETVLNSSNDRVVQEKAIFALSQHRSPRAAQILRTWAESNSRPVKLREQAIFHLGQHRDPSNGAYLRNLYAKLSPGSLKEHVLFVLSQRRNEGNEKWLMDVALSETEDIQSREKALFWAAQSRTVSMADLVGLYSRTTNPKMKEQLIFAYSQRRDVEAVDKLMDIAKNEKDKSLRGKAIFWLGQSKDPRVAKFLEDLIIR
jgi:HEAT repeat protein